MQAPLQITFRHLDHSPALETLIRERAAALDSLHERLTGCRVVVEEQHRPNHAGGRFRVRIDMQIPGHDIIVTREPPTDAVAEDPHAAVRDAFDAARRRLEETIRRHA